MDFPGEWTRIRVIDVAAHPEGEPLAHALAHPGAEDFNRKAFRAVSLRKREEGKAEEVGLDLDDVAADGFALGLGLR